MIRPDKQYPPVSSEHEVLYECVLQNSEPVVLEKRKEATAQAKTTLLLGRGHQVSFVGAEVAWKQVELIPDYLT